MNFEDENYVRVLRAAGALSKSAGGAVELKEFLDSIENIPDLNVLNEKGNSLMHMAAFNGQELVLRELADAGADINVKNEPDGWPPLHCAMYSNSFGCVNALVSMGADVNAQDAKGNNALNIAAAYSIPKVAEIILNAGADATAKNKHGQVPVDLTQDAFTYEKLSEALNVQTGEKIMSEVKECLDMEPVRARRKM
ncbi:ankyrin repeat domain-containing protein [Stenotrophomonas maltophilia]|uniref:ankyrin repeat domain-containing protein n=1 Tax=Stenotrophomonas maltophilia TaxID=40324 RepID=UPI0009B2C211|nr:ankyrin repeat domain-containing protein [Stenotrophomonas maltophilia]